MKTLTYITVFALAIAIAFLAGCAVSKNSTQISAQTRWELNTAQQLHTIEGDYRSFFKDLGDAQRAGVFSDAQVAKFNAIGDKLKLAIENANRAFKTYQATHNADVKTQVVAYINQALAAWADLEAAKASALDPAPPKNVTLNDRAPAFRRLALVGGVH